ncbi:MAG TPA: hypothetical protein VF045_04805, partial [Acidimicrobiales bacterium]
MTSRFPYFAYRAAALVAAAVPERAVGPLSRLAGSAARPFLGRRAAMVARHARRVRGEDLSGRQEREAIKAAVASYARYWIESLRLPTLDPALVDARFTIEGLDHIRAAREAGTGAVLALPHVGGWEVGGFWFTRNAFPMTVVVERVDPPELFDWFVGLRGKFGLTVIPLGK